VDLTCADVLRVSNLAPSTLEGRLVQRRCRSHEAASDQAIGLVRKFTAHEKQPIAAALGSTKIYFCDSHSPWQRPSNGMLRGYFPRAPPCRSTSPWRGPTSTADRDAFWTGTTPRRSGTVCHAQATDSWT